MTERQNKQADQILSTCKQLQRRILKALLILPNNSNNSMRNHVRAFVALLFLWNASWETQPGIVVVEAFVSTSHRAATTATTTTHSMISRQQQQQQQHHYQPSLLRKHSTVETTTTSTTRSTSGASSTKLFGIRNTLKRVLLRPFRRNRKEQQQQQQHASDESIVESTIESNHNTSLEDASVEVNYYPAMTLDTIPASEEEDDKKEGTGLNGWQDKQQQQQLRSAEEEEELAAASVATLTQEESKESNTNNSNSSNNKQKPILCQTTLQTKLYELPPINHELTSLEQEFRDMVTHFTQYSRKDVLAIKNERLRILFEGIMASAGCPAVYRAFEVLYEDLYPLRVAGRIIFKQLKKSLEESRLEQQEEVSAVVASTGIDVAAVEDARLIFLAMALKINRDTYLTLPQLLTTNFTRTAEESLGFAGRRSFMDRIDTEHKGQLRFADMMLGLHLVAEEVCQLDRCNPALIVQDVMEELVEHPPSVPDEGYSDPKREKIAKRYYSYVESFREWEGLFENNEKPNGRQQQRLVEVIHGCFVGAKTPQVVDALRVLYMDYQGLRLVGDLIFKLSSGIMEGRRRRLEKQKARSI